MHECPGVGGETGRVNGTEFVASLISSLAWPLAAVAIAFIFRGEIKKMMARQPSRLKAGPFEAEWDEAAEHTIDQLAEVREAAPEFVRITESIGSEPVALSGKGRPTPWALVAASWGRIERELQALLAANGGDPSAVKNAGGVALAKMARVKGLIDDKTANGIEGLAVMRNMAVHGHGEITREQAQEFVVLVDAMIFALHNQPGR